MYVCMNFTPTGGAAPQEDSARRSRQMEGLGGGAPQENESF